MNLMDLGVVPVVAAGGRRRRRRTWRRSCRRSRARRRLSARSRRTGRRDTGCPRRRSSPGPATIPCSLVGVGLVREGRLAISLGTSDTVFGLMREPRVDRTGTGHVFGAPTGDYMGLTCFKNGSLARERIRDQFGLVVVDVLRKRSAARRPATAAASCCRGSNRRSRQRC